MKATVNQQTFEVSYNALKQSFILNDEDIALDVLAYKPGHYHVIKNHTSYRVEVIEKQHADKKVTLKINGQQYQVQLTDALDDLLHKLGFDQTANNKPMDIKAPMPGLVKNILVAEGQTLKAGESVLVLEAMKMENVLKCTADTTVKNIKIKNGQTVEKNQLLITLM
ncbi:MAG: acetyl-CoA carboxylase biotin carboxyl carrier protein subunit [Bacteroidia bacterium]|nr:acetyl-CoA carboxylase biotin carboxyl carrier protein subunit [Bacteroidia bacterium]